MGLGPDDIDTVVMTHLHFDHSGGTTRRTASGAVEPVFKRARHVVQRREWQDATHPHERNRASYLQENVAPLGEAGLLELVDGEVEIAPGVRVLPTPGHTAGHQSVLIGPPDGPKALFLGDVVPTAVHVRLPWVMSYDLEPARTVETKRALFSRALAEDWLLVWGHDRDHVARAPGRRQGRRVRGPRAGDNLTGPGSRRGLLESAFPRPGPPSRTVRRSARRLRPRAGSSSKSGTAVAGASLA